MDIKVLFMAYFVGLVYYDLINILQPSTFVKSFNKDNCLFE